MAIRSFGSGLLIATNTASGSSPVQFGTLQDVSLDLSGTTKTLFGQNQLPVAIGRGEIKMSGKAKIGQISGELYSSLFFGSSSSSGTVKLASNEAGTVPSATTYTITVTNSATWTADQGVVYAATGLPLTQVAAGSEAQGKYSVAAGVYTFDATDASASVLISYTYTSASSGSTIDLGNPLQGVQPVFSIILQRSYNNVGERYKLWSCVSSKLTVPTKMADFAITEFDFECFANAAGKTLTVYTDE